jgi:DNA processing protein
VDERTLNWLALHLATCARPGAWRRVLSRFETPEEAFRARPADLDGLRLAESAVEAILSRDALGAAEREVEKTRGKAYSILTFEDPGYPELLKEIYDPPAVLFYFGRREVLDGPAIAIVGSRRPTPYGRLLAEKLAGDLALRGAIIVSGMALGIDACAHRGALKQGRTVAVLGSGLDVLYPPENAGLAGAIARTGAVVTEFPLGTSPFKENFPVRNRIISGLSRGLVVVEAAERSGSLISARFALEQGREVMAVPGTATSALSRGTNGLIREGAKLVETWQDVAEEMAPPWRDELLAQNAEKSENIEASLSGDEARLFAEIPADGAAHIDDVADRTGLPAGTLLALLLGLELKGLVVQHPGKYFQRRP